MFFDRATIGTTVRGTLELSLKFGARLDQPAISQRHQQDWIDLAVEDVVPSCNEAEVADIPCQDRNRLVEIGGLRKGPGRRQGKDQETCDGAHGFPASFGRILSLLVQHGLPHNPHVSYRTIVIEVVREGNITEVTFCAGIWAFQLFPESDADNRSTTTSKLLKGRQS